MDKPSPIPRIKQETDCIGIYRRFWPGRKPIGTNYPCPSPEHQDDTPSCQISEDFAYCHGCGRRWDVIDLYALGAGCTTQEAIRRLSEELGITSGNKNQPPRRPSLASGIPDKWRGKCRVAQWEYRDASGLVLGCVVRFENAEGKMVIPFFKREGAIWKAGIAASNRPLYGLDRLAARPDAQVLITEGEKAADAAKGLFPTYVVITSQGGSGAAGKTDWVPLRGRTALIWPDHDKPGLKYAAAVEQELRKVGAEIVGVIDPSALGMPDKGDAADWPPDKPLPDPLPMLTTVSCDKLATPCDVVEADQWSEAREVFPRVEYPWDALPTELAESLRSLARSCATSPTPLPGAVFAFVAAALGRSIAVSPKPGWSEPAIIWHADIRASGEGKTPAARMLARVFDERQRLEHERFDLERRHYDSLSTREKRLVPQPRSPRGYFLTDLTLEGLRTDLQDHPTGGLIAIQDELSNFIASQNQYRAGKGNDRESWLRLHDGNSARVVRAGGSIYIAGARLSMFGGVQPAIFRKMFQSNDGVYQADGTMYRLLYVYESGAHFSLDRHSWANSDRLTWERIIERTLHWAEEWCSVDQPPHSMLFSEEAQERFFGWRNEHDEIKESLPPILRGFIPKASGYIVRLAGVLSTIHAMHTAKSLPIILQVEDVERAIRVVNFHMGEVVDAMQLLDDEDHLPKAPPDQRIKELAKVLHDLRSNVDNGRLAVGCVMDALNEVLQEPQRFRTPRAFGVFIRQAGLSVSPGKHNANGHRSSKCLLWDDAMETFLRDHGLRSLQYLQSIGDQQSTGEASGHGKSAMSSSPSGNDGPQTDIQDNQPPMSESASQGAPTKADNADDADVRAFFDEDGAEMEEITI
jgi:hypothetical protein